MRILVTGGAGFIGSHLVDALLQAGHAPVVLDDFSTGKRSNLPADIEVIEGDVADPKTLQKILVGVEAVFHLAAIASVEKSAQNPERSHQVNALAMQQLVAALLAQGGDIPLVFASSAAVYGDVATLPVIEEAALNPLSLYGADKAFCERCAQDAARVGQELPSVGLRFFNVYGPRQDPSSPYSGVVSIFMDRIPNGKPVTIYGDGSDTRDFIHVSDIVRALLAALHTLQQKKLVHTVLNACTGKAVSVLTLAETIARLAGKPLNVTYAPARAGNIQHSLGAPDLAAAQLNFRATVAIEDGLKTLL